MLEEATPDRCQFRKLRVIFPFKNKKPLLEAAFLSILRFLRFPSPNVKEGDFEGYYGTFGEGEGKSVFFSHFS